MDHFGTLAWPGLLVALGLTTLVWLVSLIKGKVLDRGLWRYTRHPNYFGDATLWWGFGCFAFATTAGLWTLFSPILMSLLIIKVSGVALLEKGLTEAKPQYRDYVRRTSAFIPRPPRD